VTSEELLELMRQFEAGGGRVQVVETVAPAQAIQPIDEELAEAVREVAPLGIFEASRRLRMSPHTLYRIADAAGIEFAYAAKLREDASLVPQIRRHAGRMRQVDLASHLGISRTTLRRLARDHGININSRAR
jgi:AraC-like DNA-binding protein